MAQKQTIVLLGCVSVTLMGESKNPKFLRLSYVKTASKGAHAAQVSLSLRGLPRPNRGGPKIGHLLCGQTLLEKRTKGRGI